ncbi:hypothetical protein [Vibrio campbellii]
MKKRLAHTANAHSRAILEQMLVLHSGSGRAMKHSTMKDKLEELGWAA